MARLKLTRWDGVISDCESVLALPSGGTNIKAHYYLCQAQLEMGDYDAALDSGLTAHKLCVATNDKSLTAVTGAVLKAKKARWEQKEKMRARGEQDLEREMLRLLREERERDVRAALEDGGEVEANIVEEEAVEKENKIKALFERSRVAGDVKREVPDWAIDDISFGFMVDPVVVSFNNPATRHNTLEKDNRH